MTGHSDLFIKWTKIEDGGHIKLGDNKRYRIIGEGTIGNSSKQVRNVLLVENLKHNLLSVSQICGNGCYVLFTKVGFKIIKEGTNTVLIEGLRYENIYALHFSQEKFVKCLLASHVEVDLWHYRLGHINHKHLNRLAKNELVRGST